MCGILIAYAPNPIDRARFDAARDTLIHRGPDAQQSVFLEAGCLALGHTRLSIIDLSSRANQPMRSNNLWVTFNGEIYNYPELRKQLEAKGCQFVTSSDTEVLLHGFRIWGEDLCERLLGMFAFTIWDDETKQLFMGRDHFGQKPLYYSETGGELVAASEIKAIKAYSRHRFTLRRESIVDAMVQDFVAEPNTWYQDIKVLPAGHQMSVRRTREGAISTVIRNYWSYLPDPDPAPVKRDNALERLGSEIDEAIRSHRLADVEVGAFLSGGIDSTAIVTLASKLVDRPVKTFSIGFGGNDELPVARATAARIGAEHCEDRVAESDFRTASGNVLKIFDHPFTDTSLVPTERVSALAARRVKVALTGDGGDECFGGYDYGRYLGPGLVEGTSLGINLPGPLQPFSTWLDRCRWTALGSERWALAARERIVQIRKLSRKRARILAPELLNDLGGYDPSYSYRQHRNPKLDGFRDAQWIGIKVPLPNKMLVKVDRCSMSHSLETRAPFLSPRLVEFMLDLPTEITNPKNCWYKGLLRTWLVGKVSSEVLEGRKQGFGVPRHWSQLDDQGFREDHELLPECVSADFLKPMAWQAMRAMPHHLWRFMQIERALKDGTLSV